MGGSSSKGEALDVQNNPDFEIVVFVIYEPNAIKLIHAPQNVRNCIEGIIREVDMQLSQVYDADHTVKTKVKQGCPKLYMYSEEGFSEFSGRKGSTSGKLVVLRALEEMYKLGYDPVVSSCLDRPEDRSTIYFRKVAGDRPGRAVRCLAPGQYDTLVILRGLSDPLFMDTVRQAVTDGWPKGIDEQDMQTVGQSEELYELKLKGDPWLADTEEERFRSRQLMVNILGRLAAQKYKLMASVNLKGTTDTFYFINDETYTFGDGDFCLISLNKADRLRLSGPEDLTTLTANITSVAELARMPVKEQSRQFESWEMVLTGDPWTCDGGEQALATRRFISRMCEALIARGWALVGGLDLSREAKDDKSSLVFIRAVPFVCKFACIYLSEMDTITLVDLPYEITNSLMAAVRRSYAPGIVREKQIGMETHEIKLEGTPWKTGTGEALHGRALMSAILEALTIRNWQLVASIDVSSKENAKANQERDPHSWFFTYWPGGKSVL